MRFHLNKELAAPTNGREEATLQIRLIKELRQLLPRDAFVFAVPNGGRRNKREAAQLKNQGVTAGVPDLVLIYRREAFGLELKAKDGRLEDSQRETFPLLRNAGMRIEVARSHAEAMEHIKDMGIPLRVVENKTYEIRDIFREETKRRRA